MFVTIGAEQFGTNIRSTAATTIPNMVRGTLVLMILMFNYFKPSTGVLWSAVIVGVIAFAVGIYSTLTIPETHDRDLDFIEEWSIPFPDPFSGSFMSDLPPSFLPCFPDQPSAKDFGVEHFSPDPRFWFLFKDIDFGKNMIGRGTTSESKERIIIWCFLNKSFTNTIVLCSLLFSDWDLYYQRFNTIYILVHDLVEFTIWLERILSIRSFFVLKNMDFPLVEKT